MAPVCSPIQLASDSSDDALRDGARRRCPGGWPCARREAASRRWPWRRRSRCLAAAPAAPFSLPIGGGDVGQRLHPWPAAHDGLAGHGSSPSRRRGRGSRTTCAPLRTARAHAQREQRMVLAQVGADDQRALQRATATRCSCRASARPRRPRIRRGAGGSRCSRCPGARTSFCARNSSSTVLCGLTSAPIALAPWSRLTSLTPRATYSSAVCQSTVFHWPPCLIMGEVRRSVELSAS